MHMSGWLYLIKNRDLYKIGITKNIDNRMRQLKPDNIVAKLYTTDFIKLERELHNRYKRFRIPQTEYFRLKDYQIKEIKQRISKLDFSSSIILGMFIKSILFILLISFLILIFLSLNINDTDTIILKLLLWNNRFLFGYSFFSLFFHSGKYLGFSSELKCRFLRLIIFILFSLFFKIAYILFQ